MPPAFIVPAVTVGRRGGALSHPPPPPPPCTAPAGRGVRALRMGFRTRDQKAVLISRAKDVLKRYRVLITAPLDSFHHREVEQLRKALPEGVLCRVMKNTLMRLAAEGLAADGEPIASAPPEVTDAAVRIKPLLKMSNLWLFVPTDEEVPATLKAYTAFVDSLGRAETNALRAGFMDGQVLDSETVAQIRTLPNKKELIAKLALAIHMIPTRLAASIYAVPRNLALAIKMGAADPAKAKEREGAATGSST